jgi:hypothetical protein
LYPVIAAPPLLADGAQVRLTEPLAAVAASDCGADGATGEAAPICDQGRDSSIRPETNFPFRQWPPSTPPVLRTWPVSRYEVVVPPMVILTLGIAPELAHEAVRPPL